MGPVAAGGESVAELIEIERQRAQRVMVMHGVAANALRVAIQSAAQSDPDARIHGALAMIAVRQYDRAAARYLDEVS